MINSDYQREVVLLVHNWGKGYIWNTGDSLGTWETEKVNEKWQWPKQVGQLEDSEPLVMNIWVTPPGEEPWPTEVLTKGKRNIEYIVEVH